MLKSLQYMRGVTAMMVVYFHIVMQLELLGGGSSLLPAIGTSGVDVFFVLSGFVIWTTTRARDRNPWHFYRRRIIRVVPLYWGATATAAVAALLLPDLLESTRFDARHVLASLFFVPWPNPSFPPDSGNHVTPLVVPGWTLNYEMLFYLLFGLVLPLRPVLRGLLLTMLFLALAVAGVAIPGAPAALGFYRFAYLIEFLLGAGLAALAAKWQGPKPLFAASLLAASILLLLGLDAMSVAREPLPWMALAAALIVYAAVALDRRGGVPASSALSLLGDASYSIYLTHVFALAALRIMWRALALPVDALGQIMFLLSGLTVSAGVGMLAHLLYERPATRMTKRLFRA